MTTPRHFLYFIALGLFWGISPSLYKHLANIQMPETHTVVITGLAVGAIMLAVAIARSGWAGFDQRLILYGAGCAFLMNVPFAINLFFASKVPPTELAIIITLSPFFNYLAAMASGSENTSLRRLLAIIFGFLSTVTLLLTRNNETNNHATLWLLGSISIPLLYCAYNYFAARYWPPRTDVIQAGAAESLWSGIWMVPVLLWLNPPGNPDLPSLSAYWILIAVSLMWVMERVAYFTLINEKGAVYTVQATYISTPAAVVIGALIFGGTTDKWLWVSLALLMVALYLNNTNSPLKSVPTPQSS